MHGKNGFVNEPYKERLFINDISNQTNERNNIYPDDGYLPSSNSDESLKSIESNSFSPYAPTTTPSLHTPFLDKGGSESYTESSLCLKDFLSHLNYLEAKTMRYSYSRKPNFNDFCMKHTSFKDGDWQVAVKPKQTLSSEDRTSSSSTKAVIKPRRLQPIKQNFTRKKHQDQKCYSAQAFNVSGNAMMCDAKSNYFQNKSMDYNPGYVKRTFHHCNRCANRMSTHDHRSWLESFYLAGRARRGGTLKPIVAGEPFLSISGSKDQFLCPMESDSMKLSLIKMEEQNCEEDTSLTLPTSTSQDSSKNGGNPLKEARQCGALQAQLKVLKLTTPFNLENIQSCEDFPRSWSQKPVEDDSSMLIGEYILRSKTNTHIKLQQSSANHCKMIEDETNRMKTSQRSLTPGLETIATRRRKPVSLTNINLDHLPNIKSEQSEEDNQENAEEGKLPFFGSGSENYNDVLKTRESSTPSAPETLREYTYSVMDDKSTDVYRPDSIVSSSGAVPCLSKLPITIYSSDDELRASSSFFNLELNHNTSAIETKFTEADYPGSFLVWSSDQLQGKRDREEQFLGAERKEGEWRTKFEKSKLLQRRQKSSRENQEVQEKDKICKDGRFISDDLDPVVNIKSDVYSDHEKESEEEEECEDMLEDDDEEDALFYQMKTYPPNFSKENFALPTGKMLCYTAITDKRYNKWSRRKKRSKRKTKKKSRTAEERPSASSGNENSKSGEKYYLRYLIKNNHDTVTMRYRHDSKCVSRELLRSETFDQACSSGTVTNKKKSAKGYSEMQTQNFENTCDSTQWNECDRNEPVSSKLRINSTSTCIVPFFSFEVIDHSTAVPDNYSIKETKSITYKGPEMSLNSNTKDSSKKCKNVQFEHIKARGKSEVPRQTFYHKGKINIGEKEDETQVGDKTRNGKNVLSSIVRLSAQAHANRGKQPSKVKCTTDCYSLKSDSTNENKVLGITNNPERKSPSQSSDNSNKISSGSNSDDYSTNSSLDKTVLTPSSNSADSSTTKLQITGKNSIDESCIPLASASEQRNSEGAVSSMAQNEKFLQRQHGQRNSSFMCPLSVTFPRVNIQIRTTTSGSPSANTKNSSQAETDEVATEPQKEHGDKTIDMKSEKNKRRSKLDKDTEIITIQDLLSDMNLENQIVINKKKPTSKKTKFQGGTFREIYGKSPYTDGRTITTSEQRCPYKNDRSVSALSFTQSYTFSALPLPVIFNFDKSKSKKHKS